MTKKILVILLTAIFVFAAGGKAEASDVNADIEINDTDNTRNTQVEAKVDDGVSPTYVVTIPSKVDFGKLTRPDTDRQDLKTRDFGIHITKLENLGARQILAILASGSGDKGAFVLNNAKGKSLSYAFLEGTNKQDITQRNSYPNGWYVAASKVITESNPIQCQLSLDQNQLNQGTIDEWEGTFSGSIRFYTTIADMEDYLPASQ